MTAADPGSRSGVHEHPGPQGQGCTNSPARRPRPPSGLPLRDRPGSRARPSPGAPARRRSRSTEKRRHPVRGCRRFALRRSEATRGKGPARPEVTGGTREACAEMTGGTEKSSGARTEWSAKNVAQSTLLRLRRKEIRVTAGKPDRGAVHGSPPMDRTRLTPVGYGAAPSPTAAEHIKPPTAFTCSSGGHRMRTRRRTASSVNRNGARPFTSGRNPVVTSCDGPHTLRWGQLRMQQVGE